MLSRAVGGWRLGAVNGLVVHCCLGRAGAAVGASGFRAPCGGGGLCVLGRAGRFDGAAARGRKR